MSVQIPTGAVGWFEIGSARPERAEAFYGGLFGWTFGRGTSAGFDYRDITAATPASTNGDGGSGPAAGGGLVRGGLLNTGGQAPGYAVFVVVVDDVAASCTQAQQLGGSVDLGPITTETGLTCAYLRDPEGNRFAVFTPPTR